DLRHGLRLLARTPVATALALVSLALGIGANTALFSLTDAVLLRPLPVEHPQELALVLTQSPVARRPSTSFPNPLWEQVRDHQQEFTDAFAWSLTQFDLRSSGLEERVNAIYASGGYFPALSVHAERGRLLGPADDVPGCPAVAVISDGFWRSQFGGAATALGANLRLFSHAFQIIGVVPPDFLGADVGTRFDIAVPICAEAIIKPHPMLQVRDAWWLTVAGRLRPNETLAQAQARLAAEMPAWLAASLPTDYNAAEQQNFLKRRVSLQSLALGVSPMAQQYGLPLEILLGVAALVLLVACANLAGLMLARAMARRAEIATRLALGALRARLVRQLLTESLLLAIGGAALGAGLAVWACHALEGFWSTSARSVELNLSLDGRVLGFTVVVTLATALLVGLVPALRATRVSFAAGGRTATARGGATGRRLAAAQIALSLLLLAGAGLFLRSFVNLTSVNLGFDPAKILLVNLGPPIQRTPAAQLLAEHARILEALRAVPGVDAAAESLIVPTSGMQWDLTLRGAHGSIGDTYFNAIAPGFFGAIRTPLLKGRDFSDADGPHSAPVAILNETAARILFPDGSALGQSVQQPGSTMMKPTTVVVGVVADAKYDSSLRAPAPPEAYYALDQLGDQFSTTAFEVRSAMPAAAIQPELRAAMARVDPGASYSLGRLSSVVAGDVKPERLLATLSALFGGLALLITAIGLYGVMAYSSNRRRREFGIRMALGADPQAVMCLALGEVAAVLGWGAAAGLTLTWLSTRALEARLNGLLFGLAPTDLATFAAAAALLVAVALAAAWLPARRAARADPMRALREE
ncbi:MAG: ADOP family duplicated permease, partial [Terriglobales bacterium]